MKNSFLKILLLFSIGYLTLVIGHVNSVQAQNLLRYPIPDLGYCRDAKECGLYCEIPANKAACWSYGEYKLGSNVLGVTTMSEEEKKMMEAKAKQYNITFPIADLGNCAGPQQCRDFCEQSSNQQTCMDFAKKKGFQKETESSHGVDASQRDELIAKAKTELGCTSMESCSKICETDQGRCEAFAKKHGVYQEPPESRGRYSAGKKQELMQKAGSELGCTSMESCKSICEQNPERCMNFAKKHGFDKGQEERRDYSDGAANFGTQRFGSERLPAGRQGCDSEQSCKKYCQEHPDECPGFKGYTKAIDGSKSAEVKEKKNYVGPSGCSNEAECKNWCNDHPEKCPGFTEGKMREESSKREYELKKKQIEQNQETQKRQFETNREMMQQNYEYRPPSGDPPSYQPTTQPSSGTYTPPSGSNTIPVTP